ncbi:MAG: hypothetical protein JWQ01_584 [Massilia sp.]|jgi:hypothetical protein|nr:hypothetical protein [Massilia sp.]
MTSTFDFLAQLNQSTCDKIIDSTTYPLVALEHRKTFPGCSNFAFTNPAEFYIYSDAEIEALLKEAVTTVRTNTGNPAVSIYSEIYSHGGAIIQQAKSALTALQGADRDAPPGSPGSYEGPKEEILTNIINGGIENLVKTLKPLGDWGLYAYSPYLRVTVRDKPTLVLNTPRIDLSNVFIEVTATGELWSKFPWLNCYRYCTKWEKVVKCERIASVTVSPHIKAKLHASVQASGARVNIIAKFDELRLDYPILDKLPLEGIANDVLDNKPVFVYDASELVATIPLLKSRFSVDKIELPATSGGISVGVSIKRI